ncbi:uncharacterized protein LOC126659948 [Mercurialis annua]|uniref:uncharacterized protein LOC126659948 n=1 Tax=Mercurialis annua TaxID=3986 RepID=UPI002160451B|nr:uncharacterized protein LOC126659948 [Mercurialis annua]
MAILCGGSSNLMAPTQALPAPKFNWAIHKSCTETKSTSFILFAAKSDGFSLNSILKGCKTCGGKGAVECAGCKGSGKNKKNGNIFERWKCFDCQGFGLKSCPNCGKGGLTPEQRGER